MKINEKVGKQQKPNMWLDAQNVTKNKIGVNQEKVYKPQG